MKFSASLPHGKVFQKSQHTSSRMKVYEKLFSKTLSKCQRNETLTSRTILDTAWGVYSKHSNRIVFECFKTFSITRRVYATNSCLSRVLVYDCNGYFLILWTVIRIVAIFNVVRIYGRKKEGSRVARRSVRKYEMKFVKKRTTNK